MQLGTKQALKSTKCTKCTGKKLSYLIVTRGCEDERQLSDPVGQPAEDVDRDDGQNESRHLGVRLLLALRGLRVLRAHSFQFDDHLKEDSGSLTLRGVNTLFLNCQLFLCFRSSIYFPSQH